MKVSTKSRYAIKLLLDISENEHKGKVSLRDVSSRTGITVKYLEQIASMLCRTGFIRSQRGAQGGYTLARANDRIKIGEVIRAMDGDLSADYINDGKIFDRFWKKMYVVINNYIDSVTLFDIQEEKKIDDHVDEYYI